MRLSRSTNMFTHACYVSGVVCLLLMASCKREQRQLDQAPSATPPNAQVTMSQLMPGAQSPPPRVRNESEERAYDVNEGKRLFTQYNCSGCHANGGGAIGP